MVRKVVDIVDGVGILWVEGLGLWWRDEFEGMVGDALTTFLKSQTPEMKKGKKLWEFKSFRPREPTSGR